MTQQLEKTWLKEIFTADELKQYAEFETAWKSNSTAEQKATFEKNWSNLVSELEKNLKLEPSSTIGIDLGKKCMDLINGIYGKKYAHLRTKKFERGFGEGKGLDEVGLTPETVLWLDKAIDAYWRDRIYAILNKVGSIPSDTLLKLWTELLDDMYGEDELRKKEIYALAPSDPKVSQKAKEWLKNISSKLDR